MLYIRLLLPTRRDRNDGLHNYQPTTNNFSKGRYLSMNFSHVIARRYDETIRFHSINLIKYGTSDCFSRHVGIAMTDYITTNQQRTTTNLQQQIPLLTAGRLPVVGMTFYIIHHYIIHHYIIHPKTSVKIIKIRVISVPQNIQQQIPPIVGMTFYPPLTYAYCTTFTHLPLTPLLMVLSYMASQ